MGDASVPYFLGEGTTKTYQIPISHLDYKFIEKCTDVKHLEKILRVLRSGEEGCYPELTMVCEKRIECLDPRSRALRKDKPAATASDFTAEEWQAINSELMSWLAEMNEDDKKSQLLRTDTPNERQDNLPPIRCSSSCLPTDQNKKLQNKQRSKKNIPRDYSEWDKFDVEKECSKIDEDCEESNSKARFFSRPSLPIIEKKIDTTGMTKREKIFIATREKEKGNEAFATGDYVEAVTYYTRSLSVIPTAAVYNNKAQAEIKLQDWDNALQDCEKVLDMEPGNIKGSGAAAAARAAAGEPAMGNAHRKSHGKGKAQQDRDTHKHKDSAESGGKKGASEKKSEKHLSDHEGEVNGFLRSDEKSESAEAEEISTPHREGSHSAGGGSSTSLPPTAAKLKNEGNELFKSGQFGEAVLKYSEAIEYVTGLGEQSPDDLSILYSNRAACYLKEGNCSDCIQDCNRALELQPFSLKPLLRRAMASESMERYRQAYIDYKTVLQIDSSIQAANDSANRITKTLIDQDGPSWREKLPPIPVVPVAAQLHRWDGGSLTSENKPSTIDINREEELQMNCEEATEKFKRLKNEGNDFVKMGEYEEAANKYSECMKLNTEECTVYTNRALCYLKLYKYEEAKRDCDHVLQIEDSNIKAFYRRALAYKGLQNYQASADDFNKVLLIDPNVVEAQKELEEVTQLLHLDSSAGDGSQQAHGKKITIQEVTDPDAQGEGHFATSEDAEAQPVAAEEAAPKAVPRRSSERLRASEPPNAYDFGQIINALNASQDKAACADLLTTTDPKTLPVLLSNKLEGEILLIFIQSLEHYIAGKDPGLVYQHLFYLSKAKRFKVVLALLSKNEKEEIQHLFDLLTESQSDQYSLEDLESLKQVYEL
ncbi:sperm-associated antigen 1 isoform X2 [Agelaius phoeniceus]|uniref:sperm-associated antigen 1 isoform X2 n=1 Tax=Agelaius phoeniceus TaxID=39638 RepID=UPI004054EB77